MALVGFEDRYECLPLHDSCFTICCKYCWCKTDNVGDDEICMPILDFSDDFESEQSRIEFLEFRK